LSIEESRIETFSSGQVVEISAISDARILMADFSLEICVFVNKLTSYDTHY
jgi:hypothetical protein